METLSETQEMIKRLEKIIKDTQNCENPFQKRQGKVTPALFVQTFTYGQADLHEITLDTLCVKMIEISRIGGGEVVDSLKKQALFQRLESGAVIMESVFKKLMSEFCKQDKSIPCIEVLRQFEDILITDGSTISLPDKLEELYKGLGGKNASAALKIQATFSVACNEFSSLKLYAATTNDAHFNQETIKEIRPNVLYVRDLGYYSVEYFEALEKEYAYYLSRIKTSTRVYQKTPSGEYTLIDWQSHLGQCTYSTLSQSAYIRKKSGEYFEVRLVAFRLSDEIANQRKHKARKESEKNGRQLTKKVLILLEWCIYITNVPDDLMSAETICHLYRLRWQIELVFKALKSSLDFEKFPNAGISYFKCLLYGRLVVALLNLRIYRRYREILFKKTNRLISIQRFIRNFRAQNRALMLSVVKPSLKNIRALINVSYAVAVRSLFERRTRMTTEYELMEHDLPEGTLLKLCS